MNDCRAVEVVVEEKGVRKVVGRALTDKTHNAFELLIDDPDVARLLAGGLKEGSFGISIPEK